jgi:hypothetical protein
MVTAATDMLDPAHPRQVLLVTSNATVSKRTGRPIGSSWSELTDPYWEFSRSGRFKPHSVQSRALITGQQQYSAAAAAKLIVEALGQ